MPLEARKLNGVHNLHNGILENCALKHCGIISYGDYAARGENLARMHELRMWSVASWQLTWKLARRW